MLKKIGLAVLVLVGLFCAFVASRPAEFRIARSRTVDAPPAVVYSYVSDFRKWPQWSPWEKLDPAMQRDLSGGAAGEGAVYHWSGNDQVGEGRMTITEAEPAQSLTVRLEFLRPFAATNTARFDFAPSGQGTNVTWAMTGSNNFIAKAMGLFMDMDAMVGADFEKGLEALNAVSSAEAASSGPTQ